jgi:hypothetical protein
MQEIGTDFCLSLFGDVIQNVSELSNTILVMCYTHKQTKALYSNRYRWMFTPNLRSIVFMMGMIK